jgi:hypothetical protein
VGFDGLQRPVRFVVEVAQEANREHDGARRPRRGVTVDDGFDQVELRAGVEPLAFDFLGLGSGLRGVA